MKFSKQNTQSLFSLFLCLRLKNSEFNLFMQDNSKYINILKQNLFIYEYLKLITLPNVFCKKNKQIS